MPAATSIIFDFDSIVDITLSTILWIRAVYRDSDLNNFDKHRIMYTPIENLKFDRCMDPEGLFKSMITSDEYKDRADDVLKSIYQANEEEILKYASITSCRNLINGYNKAGGGFIKSTIRVDNDVQEEFIKKNFDMSMTFLVKQKRNEVDVEPYSRIVVGNYRDAFEYRFDGGKSIAVLDFRENFMKDDITSLSPELVIGLGDVNHIMVMSAYIDNNTNLTN